MRIHVLQNLVSWSELDRRSEAHIRRIPPMLEHLFGIRTDTVLQTEYLIASYIASGCMVWNHACTSSLDIMQGWAQLAHGYLLAVDDQALNAEKPGPPRLSGSKHSTYSNRVSITQKAGIENEAGACNHSEAPSAHRGTQGTMNTRTH